MRPLLAIAVEDGRRVRLLVLATLLLVFVGWAVTSILAGSGVPFDRYMREL